MRTIQILQKILMSTILLLTILAFASCTDTTDTKKEDSKEIADDKNDAKFEAKDKERDAEFLTEVAEINITEIKLGQLAQQKSKNAEVIKLGKMMETDHAKTLEEVKGLAGKKQVTLPTDLSAKMQQEYDELNTKNAKEFDKEYTDMMVEGHKDAISLFEKTLKDTKDVDINNWAEKTLPALRMHLEHSEACRKNLK